ncbi:hypothetical protein MFIFM68171_02060 [Madurella fahalii]|uniref:G domain-containing protein n=1 Tax=Madurella fahalii TaxID=1157608 RepID=A0ABQ0G2R9_9PEZI
MDTQTIVAAPQLRVVVDAKPRRDKVMIALLGVTGAGKSTFINTATGQDVVKTSPGSQPCTQDPKAIEFRLDDRTIVLIDTPGFDDSKRSDVRILEDIATWMAKGGFLKERMLDGLIFLHPITLARAGGSELNRTKLLEKILGPNTYNRVLIATTMWDYVASEDLVKERLETRFAPGGVWHELKELGASCVRHENTQQSAHDIVRRIINITDKFGKPKTLLETELKEKQGRVAQTSAGKTLEARLHEEIKMLQEQIFKNLEQRPPGSYKNDGDREHRATWKRWNKDQRILKNRLLEKEQELKKLQNIVFKASHADRKETYQVSLCRARGVYGRVETPLKGAFVDRVGWVTYFDIPRYLHMGYRVWAPDSRRTHLHGDYLTYELFVRPPQWKICLQSHSSPPDLFMQVVLGLFSAGDTEPYSSIVAIPQHLQLGRRVMPWEVKPALHYRMRKELSEPDALVQDLLRGGSPFARLLNNREGVRVVSL